jgi:hypothetical protein
MVEGSKCNHPSPLSAQFTFNYEIHEMHFESNEYAVLLAVHEEKAVSGLKNRHCGHLPL